MKLRFSSLLLLASSFFLSKLHSQVTWFGETTGPVSADIEYSGQTIQGAVRLPDGRFAMVSLGDAGELELRLMGADGSLQSSWKDATGSLPPLKWLTGVQLMQDGQHLLVSGSDFAGAGMAHFLVGKLNLVTRQLSVVTYAPLKPYGAAPSVSEEDHGISVAYPNYNYSTIAKYDLDLNPLWGKSFLSVGMDTTISKMPSLAGASTEDAIYVCSKDFDRLAVASYSLSGIRQHYWRFPATGYTRVRECKPISDGNLILTGSIDTCAFIMKFSPAGAALWCKIVQGSSLIYSFDAVLETPDGHLRAFCDPELAGFCEFDQDGNLIGSHWLNSATRTYRMCPPYLDADGITMGGIATDDSISYEGVLQFTGLDFVGSCDHYMITCSSTDFAIGTPMDLPADSILEWTRSFSPPVTLTLSPATHPAPTICNSVTSFLEEIGDGFELHPNPVLRGDGIQIRCGRHDAFTVQVVTACGQTYGEFHLNHASFVLPTDRLVPGVYLIRLTDAKGSTSSRRVIVR